MLQTATCSKSVEEIGKVLLGDFDVLESHGLQSLICGGSFCYFDDMLAYLICVQMNSRT